MSDFQVINPKRIQVIQTNILPGLLKKMNHKERKFNFSEVSQDYIQFTELYNVISSDACVNLCFSTFDVNIFINFCGPTKKDLVDMILNQEKPQEEILKEINKFAIHTHNEIAELISGLYYYLNNEFGEFKERQCSPTNYANNEICFAWSIEAEKIDEESFESHSVVIVFSSDFFGGINGMVRNDAISFGKVNKPNDA